MNDALTWQVILGVLGAYAIQWLKRASWFPAFSEESSKVAKRLVSAVVAAGAAFAVNFDWNAAAGVLTISGLTWANLAHGIQQFLVSFLTQHATFRMLIDGAAPPAVVMRPLTGPKEDRRILDSINRSSFRGAGMLLLIVAVSLSVSACGARGKPLQVAMDANVGIRSTLFALQDSVAAIHDAGRMRESDWKAWNAKLSPALRLGRSLNDAVDAWPSGTPMPAEVPALVEKLRPLIDDLLRFWTDPTRAEVQARLDAVQAAFNVVWRLAITGGAR